MAECKKIGGRRRRASSRVMDGRGGGESRIKKWHSEVSAQSAEQSCGVSPSGRAETSLNKPRVAWVHQSTEGRPSSAPSCHSICIVLLRFQPVLKRARLTQTAEDSNSCVPTGRLRESSVVRSVQHARGGRRLHFSRTRFALRRESEMDDPTVVMGTK